MSVNSSMPNPSVRFVGTEATTQSVPVAQPQERSSSQQGTVANVVQQRLASSESDARLCQRIIDRKFGRMEEPVTESFIEFIKKLKPSPIYIHCYRGRD